MLRVVFIWIFSVSVSVAAPIVVLSDKTTINQEFLWISKTDTAPTSFFQTNNFREFEGQWVWLRLEFDNRRKETDFYLILKTSEILSFQGNNEIIRAGSFVPLSQRSNPLNRFALKVKLLPFAKQHLHFKVKVEKNFEKNIRFETVEHLTAKERLNQIEMAFLQGVLWVMVLYNLIVFFAIKQQSYLLYSLLFGTNAIYFLASDFMISPLLGIEFAYLDSYLNNYFSVLYLIAFILFTISYLNTSQKYPYIHKILLLLLLICGGMLVNFAASFGINQFDYKAITSAINLANILKLPIIAFGLYISGFFLIDPDRSARYYAYANLSLFFGGIVYLFNEEYLGFIPPNPITDRSLQVGVILQALLFSRALAAKISAVEEESRLKDLETEKIKAQQAQEISKIVEQKNLELEHLVTQRTLELQQTNTLLEENQEELHLTIAQLDQSKQSLESSLLELENKRKIIEQTNRNLMSSISYGSRIQRALLPSYKFFSKCFKDSFIFYLPRDVVSGDFYWLQEKDNIVYVAAMDCTGHGVPGAFMSLIGQSIFNQVFFSSKDHDITQMLHLLNEGVIQSLQKETSKNTDGMDIALCAIDLNRKTIDFAGAKGQALMILDGKSQIVRGNRFSIGDRVENFEKRVFSYQNYACVYLFSDGYQHQFGGPNSRKFMLKPLVDMLEQNHNLPMFKQMEKLGHALQSWMQEGKEKQIDDIMVLGFRV
jgi:serine phosphatase RsbU (regulator of sigma subunit)